MSVESRIRDGLRANTQRLRPALEHDDELVMRKVEQRRRERRIRYAGAGALVAAAVATGAVWAPSTIQDDDRPPVVTPDDRSATATPLPVAGPVEPGTYEAHFNGGGPSTPRATVEVPTTGFVAWDRSAVVERGGTHAVGFWTAARVKQDPCDADSLGVDPGPLVSDLVAALGAQARTSSTGPVRVTLGGYDGLFLELTVPDAGCQGRRIDLWTIGAGGARHVEPGEVLSLWILDVEGHRLVVDASGSDDGSDVGAQVDEMVDSVRIVAAESPVRTQ